MFFTGGFFAGVVAAMSLSTVSASPVMDVVNGHAQMIDWLATTDAKIIYIGEPINNNIARRNALNTIVTYCNTRVNGICGGTCTVYNGNAACLHTPNTQCLSATHNVGFCSSPGCVGDCNPLATCGVRLDSNFCFTPGTEFILVGTLTRS